MRMLSRQLTVRLRLHLAWAPPAGLGPLHHPRRQEAHVTATYASTPPPSTFLDDTPMVPHRSHANANAPGGAVFPT